MYSYQPGETIAAIATPLGEGGIAIIRIAGKKAIEVADRVFSGPVHSYESHTLHFGRIVDQNDRLIDEALLSVMVGRRSYTGEDTVEIHCHGGLIASRRVLEVVFAAGARPARPGEFTFKAFMNGKLDLTQAESVQQLIGAKSEKAFDLALSHLEGALSRKISAFQEKLVAFAAILEAWVDFPEDETSFATRQEMVADLGSLIQEMRTLLQTFHDGRKVEQGVSLCIAGAPNVGKSSLLNALLEQERAIVSAIPGTTRDLIEADLTLGGVHFRLQDTAGIRPSEEPIEQEGISRSKKAMERADLTLLLLDAFRPLETEDRQLLDSLDQERAIVVWNKIDLPMPKRHSLPHPHVVEISAKERLGLKELQDKISQVLWEKGAPATDEVLITSLRHKEALAQAIEGSERALSGVRERLSPEFPASDIRNALQQLGTIIGTDVTEDILSAIFSTFCIGK
ncbi:MAG: tRNA modification GTPase MnmE [Chlamydiae bacterium]|nr:tRNA modification GTPase MnmE [Chlamydiota bacterium]